MNKGLAKAYRPVSNSSTRIKNDFYPTPQVATLALIKNVDIPGSIWEPCAGRGHISKVLKDNEISVISTDLHSYPDKLALIDTGVDYLTSPKQSVGGIITNPPFEKNLPMKMISKALITDNYKFVAMLCRLTFMESAKRYHMFTNYPPSEILVLSERVHVSAEYIDKNNGIGGMVAYAWFVWDYRYSFPKQTILKWVKPSDYIKDMK